MANKGMEAVAKTIANREDISKHTKTIAKAHVENKIKLEKAKQDKKAAAKPDAKKKVKNGKK